LAIEAFDNDNDNGYYPIWATCQGWEILSIALSNDAWILDNVTGDTNVNRNMTFTYSAVNSRLWADITPNLLYSIMYENITFYDHNNSVSPERLYTNTGWAEIMDVSSISYAGDGRWFIGSAECKNYPIYGNQFHPEKNTFEWKPALAVSHSYEAVVFEQWCANFLVQEARKNCNTFPNTTALNFSLIYNWNVIQPISRTTGPIYLFQTVSTNSSAWPGLFNASNYTGQPL